MKVAIYCRVSTDQQELTQQIKSCEDFCRYKEFEFEIFSDIMSGKDMQRPQFLIMLDRIRKRDFDGIVVFRFDRLGRNAREVVTLFEEFESKGIQVFSLNENIDTTNPSGRAVRDIIVRLAQLERENISAATKQRLQALKSLGKHIGRPHGSRDKKLRKTDGYKARWRRGGKKVPLNPIGK
jgi:DNA invertase Pin-like site-specific DNA recombinase